MVPAHPSYNLSVTLMQPTPLSGNDTLAIFSADTTCGLMKAAFTVKSVRIDSSGPVQEGQKNLNWD